MAARDENLDTILDNTGLLKQGKHSVGFGPQYTGSAGKITNCQIAVTLAVYTARRAALVDLQLNLPRDWTDAAARMAKDGVPGDIIFETKGEIAVAMLKAAYRDGVPLGKLLLADADYGRLVGLRARCREVGMQYGVGIHSSQRIWDAEGIWTQRLTVGEVAAMTERTRWRRIVWWQEERREEVEWPLRASARADHRGREGADEGHARRVDGGGVARRRALKGQSASL